MPLSQFSGTIHFENGVASLRPLLGDLSGVLPLPLVLIDPNLAQLSLNQQLGAAFAFLRQTRQFQQDQQVTLQGDVTNVSGVTVLEVQ